MIELLIIKVINMTLCFSYLPLFFHSCEEMLL